LPSERARRLNCLLYIGWQQLLHPLALEILLTYLGRWRRLLIIHREVIPDTIIDVVHEAIQGQGGCRVARLQRDGNIGEGIAAGEQRHRGLGAVLGAADEHPVIVLGLVIVHPERKRFTGASPVNLDDVSGAAQDPQALAHTDGGHRA